MTLQPPCRLISVASLRRELDTKLRRDLPLRPERFLTVLARLGFISGDPRTVYPALLDFYSQQVLGFYEPGADEMVIVDRPAPVDGSADQIWAHELAHAVQERLSRLPSRLLAMRSNGDAQRAASAVAEGDAMLVMFLASAPAGNEHAVLEAAAGLLERQRLPVLPGVPEFFVEELMFPYTAGFRTARERFRQGGWPALNELLRRPPPSTAALLRPAAVLSRRPIADGDLPAVPAGYREVFTDTIGEWALAFWLGRALPRAVAAELASVWDGDRVRVIARAGDDDEWALVWRLRCRDVAARKQVEPVLAKVMPGLLAGLGGGEVAVPLTLTWVASGRELELRAAWPTSPSRRPGQKSSG